MQLPDVRAGQGTRQLEDEAMRRVTEGNEPQACELRLAGRTGTPRAVQARVAADPAGAAFLIAVMAP